MHRKEKHSLVVVDGDDMNPAISIGERLEIEAVPPEQIMAGDIIVFRRYVLIAHRVLSTLRYGRQYFFLTHGDKCVNVDLPVPYMKVVGRVIDRSGPISHRKRNKILFAILLSWCLPTSHILNIPIIRRLNKMVIHFTSLIILK
jgi:signal peptidase I